MCLWELIENTCLCVRVTMCIHACVCVSGAYVSEYVGARVCLRICLCMFVYMRAFVLLRVECLRAYICGGSLCVGVCMGG